MDMYYGRILPRDSANGIGVRTVLFVSGCTHHCKGCFQPQTWDFTFGSVYTKETEDLLVKYLEPDFVDGLTLLGGEPFEPENQEALCRLTKRIRRELPGKTIWAYSGYTYEELIGEVPGSRCRTALTEELLAQLDVLVDGEFVESQRDLTLLFRGSRNQRLIDVPRTRREGIVCLWGS